MVTDLPRSLAPGASCQLFFTLTCSNVRHVFAINKQPNECSVFFPQMLSGGQASPGMGGSQSKAWADRSRQGVNVFPRLPSPGNMARGNGDIVTYAGKARGRRAARLRSGLGNGSMFAYAERCAVLFCLSWLEVGVLFAACHVTAQERELGICQGMLDVSRSRQAAFARHGNRGIAMAAVPHGKHHHGRSVSGRGVLQTSPGIHGDDLSLIPVSSSVNTAGFEVGDTSFVPDRHQPTNHPVETLTRNRAPPPQKQRGARHFQVIPDHWMRRGRSRPSQPSTSRNVRRSSYCARYFVESLRVCWKHAIADQQSQGHPRPTDWILPRAFPAFLALRVSLRLPFQTSSKHGSAGGGVSNEKPPRPSSEQATVPGVPWHGTTQATWRNGLVVSWPRGQTWFLRFHGSKLCEPTSPSPLAASVSSLYPWGSFR